MKPYELLKNSSSADFLRITGLSEKNFSNLQSKVEAKIEADKVKNPLKRRGLKTSKLSSKNRILLTLYYLRHYPTFQNLAHVFGINESYCHKIYTRYARLIAQVERLPNHNELINNKKDTLIIDVSEQPIERPVKHQKNYYSGKKTAYN